MKNYPTIFRKLSSLQEVATPVSRPVFIQSPGPAAGFNVPGRSGGYDSAILGTFFPNGTGIADLPNVFKRLRRAEPNHPPGVRSI